MARTATVGDRVEAAIPFTCHGVTVKRGDQGVIKRFGKNNCPVVHWSNGIVGSVVWGEIYLC